jgi:hypothetical protein
VIACVSCAACSDIKPARAPESMPADKKVLTGTSATKWLATESRSAAETRACTSSGAHFAGRRVHAAAQVAATEKWLCVLTEPASSITSALPAGRAWIAA